MNAILVHTEFCQAYRAGKCGLVVTGPVGSGKTQVVSALAQTLREEGQRVAGVVSPRILKGGKTVGYLVRDLSTGREFPLCSETPPGVKFRRFYFSPEGLAFANAVLAEAAEKVDVVVIDEIGPLELLGKGFAPGLNSCLRSSAYLVLTVRPHLLEDVLRLVGLDLAILRLKEGQDGE